MRKLALLAVVLLSACSRAVPMRVTSPEVMHAVIDTDARIKEFHHPPQYRIGFASVEACSGLRGDIDEWRFFEVMADYFALKGEEGTMIAATTMHNSMLRHIYIATPYLLTPHVVMHEMLHALGAEEDSPLFKECKLQPVPIQLLRE